MEYELHYLPISACLCINIAYRGFFMESSESQLYATGVCVAKNPKQAEVFFSNSLLYRAHTVYVCMPAQEKYLAMLQSGRAGSFFERMTGMDPDQNSFADFPLKAIHSQWVAGKDSVPKSSGMDLASFSGKGSVSAPHIYGPGSNGLIQRRSI